MSSSRARWLLLTLPLLAVPLLGVEWLVTRDAVGRSALPVLGRVPEFSLVERSGSAVTRASLSGSVWVVDFIFTYCAGPCPMMTARMARLQEAVRSVDGAKLVTVTVDPDRDTPEVLRSYADSCGADRDRWWFLTGDRAAVRSLVVEGFKLGDVDEPMNHSTRFVLVDGTGAIRGYYDSAEDGMVSRLASDIRLLAR